MVMYYGRAKNRKKPEVLTTLGKIAVTVLFGALIAVVFVGWML